MISRRRLFGLLATGALAFTPFAAFAFSPEVRNAKLDDIVKGLVEGRSTPGVVVLIMQDGKPAYRKSFGVREVGSQAAIGESDMFR
ncbi:serine hydrolase, partial [Streptomyces niveiscabiei]